MTNILRSIYFVLYLQDCLIDEHHTFGTWISDPAFDLIIAICQHDSLIFMYKYQTVR